MTWESFFYPHRVTIRAAVAGGGMGGGHADPVPNVAAEVDDTQRLVRTTDAREVVSSTQVTVPLDTHVPVGSLVTVWPGTSRQRESVVLAVAADDNTDSDLDSFLVLSLE